LRAGEGDVWCSIVGDIATEPPQREAGAGSALEAELVRTFDREPAAHQSLFYKVAGCSARTIR